jgi:hypothetical protein
LRCSVRFTWESQLLATLRGCCRSKRLQWFESWMHAWKVKELSFCLAGQYIGYVEGYTVIFENVASHDL